MGWVVERDTGVGDRRVAGVACAWIECEGRGDGAMVGGSMMIAICMDIVC